MATVDATLVAGAFSYMRGLVAFDPKPYLPTYIHTDSLIYIYIYIHTYIHIIRRT